MAARKSCTHLTWSEAKSKDGSGPGVVKKKGEKPKKLNPTEKMIAKHSVPPDEQKRNKAAMQAQERHQAKLAQLADQKNAERKLRAQKANIRPVEQARERQQKRAQSVLASNKLPNVPTAITTTTDDDELELIVQCKEMQLSETAALEAIFVDSDDCRMCPQSQRDALEAACCCADDVTTTPSTRQSVIARHPPLSYVLRMEIEDEERVLSADWELVAFLLLQVTIPPSYPLLEVSNSDDDAINMVLPRVDLISFECYDKNLEMNPDKVMDSMALLRTDTFLQAMREQMKSILPDLVVYEACVTWSTEHLWEYCELNPTTINHS